MSHFVTIEGIEGAGKSTLRSRVSDYAESLGVEVVVTREPGATSLGQAVRNLVLDPKNKKIAPLAELMLFAADRAQHLEEVVRPALARGALVICDRYIHSTIAYQGYGRGLDLLRLEQLNDFVTNGLKPNLVLLLDLPPEQGLQRAQTRARKATGTFNVQDLKNESTWNRFEDQALEFHRKVREGFLKLSKDDKTVVVLDAGSDADTVANAAINAIRKLLSVKA